MPLLVSDAAGSTTISGLDAGILRGIEPGDLAQAAELAAKLLGTDPQSELAELQRLAELDKRPRPAWHPPRPSGDRLDELDARLAACERLCAELERFRAYLPLLDAFVAQPTVQRLIRAHTAKQGG